MEVQDKKFLVVGAGRSGLAVAGCLVNKGARVVLTDGRVPEQGTEMRQQLSRSGVKMVLGSYPPVTAGAYDALVMSPGVPLTIPPVVQAKELGLPVISELELAYRFSRAPIVAVTGTNGKTTVTSLVGQIFQEAGFNTLVAGNIGLPLVTKIEKYGPGDVVVAEVSSFQLETTVDFRPRVGAVLNITPDHLDRHGSMKNYIQAKARVFINQSGGDFAVLNYDDEQTRVLAKECPAQVIFFSRRHILEHGVFVQDGQIVTRLNGVTTPVAGTDELQIPGPHNLENALAAVAMTMALGVSAAEVARTLRRFAGVAHRLEFVAEINGIKYVNDSKGTNPDAAMKALDAYEQPIVLIAGGKNKGNDFGAFARKIKEKVRVLVLVGLHGPQIEQAARDAGFNAIQRADNFPDTVRLAHRYARPGDVVLLSPACASWDMFNSYEERGDLFRKLVLELKE